MAAARGAAARRRDVRVRPPARRRSRTTSSASRRTCGSSAAVPTGWARTSRRSARTARRCTRRGRALPLAGEWTLAGFCAHLAALDLWPAPPEWDVAPAPAQLGVRVGGARPGPAPGRSPAARRARAGAAAGALRQLARPRRGALDRAAAAAARPLARRALQARRGGDLAAGARRRGRRNGRGRHDRFQGPVRPGGQGSGRAGRTVRPRPRRRFRTRIWRIRTTCPGSRSGSAITSSACPTTRRSEAPRTSARRRFTPVS